MARIEAIEQRLQEWAQWLKVGDGSGYPVKCVLHPEWSPPTPGLTPTLKVAAASGVRSTHAEVRRLSGHLQATLVLHYVMALPLKEQADRLQCKPETIGERIRTAHRLLAQAFMCGEGVLHN